jgi:transketolase
MSASQRERFVSVLDAAIESDDRLAVVLADISVDRFRASGAMARHPDRVVNVGIREPLMVSVAAGMALEGMRPVAHSYAPFLIERSFEQLKIDFGHQGVGGVFVSVGASYDWAGGGRTHQCPGDVALIRTIPGFDVVVPGHADEVEAALRAALASDRNVYIRLSELSNAEGHPEALGRVMEVRRGDDDSPTILAVGPMLDAVLGATADSGATVLYAATPEPLDAASVAAHVRSTELAVVEPYLEGTTAPAVLSALPGRALRLVSIGVPKVELRRYGSPREHARAYGLDAPGIRQRLDAWQAIWPSERQRHATAARVV